MFREKLAVIIPTKDRPSELNRLLQSICAQDTMPMQIIIVDGGIESAEGIARLFSDRLAIDYIRKTPASLTVQRNIGIKRLHNDVTLAAFFDDDIVLEKRCLKNMLEFWATAPSGAGGASFNNMSDCHKKPDLAQTLFLVNSRLPGRILRSGFQSKLCSLEKTSAVEWLVGCAMIFRRKIFDEFTFDEWFSGYARYEDVDFSYRVGKKYALYVVANAQIRHLNRAEDRHFSFSLGRMEIVNRVYFVRKNSGLSVGLCYWALFGFFINNIMRGVFLLNKRYGLRAMGNLAGFFNTVKRPVSRMLLMAFFFLTLSSDVMGRVIEEQVKFEVSDPAVFDDIEQSKYILSYKAKPKGIYIYEDYYYDTPGLDLFKLGYSYRLRIRDYGTGELEYGLQFKKEYENDSNKDFNRIEIDDIIPENIAKRILSGRWQEAYAGSYDIGTIDKFLRFLNENKIDKSLLMPRIYGKQKRIRIRLKENGDLYFEVSLDNCGFNTIGGPKGKSIKFSQLEFENKFKGDPETMEQRIEGLITFFTQTYSVKITRESKYKMVVEKLLE